MIPIDGEPARPAFILSTERSGSTLLRYLVDAHPEVVSPGEILLGRLCFDLYITLLRTVVATLEIEDPIAANREALRQARGIIDGVMTTYARARGKKVWCDKTPNNLEYLEVLTETFPDARWVCLYRDGLDVAHSCLEVSREGFMVELAPYVQRRPGDLVGAMLESWCDKTERLLRMESYHPKSCHRVRYEDLVARPEEVLPPLFAFLGVDWDPGVLERAFTMRHDQGGGDPLIRSTNKVESDRIGRGRTLKLSRVAIPTRVRANRLLLKLGYEAMEI